MVVILICGLCVSPLLQPGSVSAQTPKPLSPKETVRRFYDLLRQKKYVEAFQYSVYSPAVESLSPAQFKFLETDFLAMAEAIPENVTLKGEQITGSFATVYLTTDQPQNSSKEIVTVVNDKDNPMGVLKTESSGKVVQPGQDLLEERTKNAQIKPTVTQTSNDSKSKTGIIKAESQPVTESSNVLPVNLILVDGQWKIGDAETQALVNTFKDQYFFYERDGAFQQMQANEGSIYNLISTLANVEMVYARSNNGFCASIPELIKEGILQENLNAMQIFGYRYEVVLSADRTSFAIYAEPINYPLTGRFSYFADQAGVQVKELNGSRLQPGK
ncbi:MAG: hypothetical protein HY774_10200 [Acidobacteria bacterium]|nr:hypothetical protein [Acidobacteriota bacterium]